MTELCTEACGLILQLRDGIGMAPRLVRVVVALPAELLALSLRRVQQPKQLL